MPEISVIVPVYKVEKYLNSCVDSILAQTFTDFELILVDDGSPDNCGAICDEYAAKDSRIRVIHQKNQGLSCARNTGIDASVGEFICFVDSDDIVSPDYCATLLGLLRGTKYSCSFCGVHRFSDGELPIPDQTEEYVVVSGKEYLRMQLERETEFGVWNKLFRKSVFAYIRFEPGVIHEDVLFSADMVNSMQGQIIGSSRELYFYRQREGGIVSAHAQRCSPDRIYAGEYLLETVRRVCPEFTDIALRYAIEYPWMFLDPIYVRFDFWKNRRFLKKMQRFLRNNVDGYRKNHVFSNIITKRMHLFSISMWLYAINAYARLLRVAIFSVLGKDAYCDEHGI